jgi:tripartite-type tricarboxylate transporter receptor subunit TctC
MRGPSWVTALALVSMAGAAAAQTWPDKPVRIVVPLTAGSATDLMRAVWPTRRQAELMGPGVRWRIVKKFRSTPPGEGAGIPMLP